MEIRLYMMPVVTEVLGPYKRCAFWVQGCLKKCKGCIAPAAQSLNEGECVLVSELAEIILNLGDIEGITISGGEPFLQQEALCELIDVIKAEKNLGIILYTGMMYSEICDSSLARKCDLIIDGEYIENLDDGKSLRGSSNQNIIDVSGRYSREIEESYGSIGRKVELIERNKSYDLIGIPSKSISKILK